jgi:beta-lactamase regulating signal transducer with metallopeptidase domain/Skp family chaperone for outer membrane proteins
MNELLVNLTASVLRNSIALILTAGIVAAALRLFKVKSPTIRRVAYLGVIVQGCLLARLNIEIPLLQAPGPVSQQLPIRNDQRSATETSLVPISNEILPGNTNTGTQASLVPLSKEDVSQGFAVSWRQMLAIAWGAGIILLVGRAVWNYCHCLIGLSLEQQPASEWLSEWNEMQRAARIRSPIPLQLTEHAGPMLCLLPGGYRLIVPVGYWSQLQPVQRAAILRHELAHLLRGDVWKSLAMRMLALPQWFNPCVWWAVNRFDDCAEWACDEAAKTAEPDHVTDYARALLQLGVQAKAYALSSPAASRNGLSRRIYRLLSKTSPKDSKMKKSVMIALIVGVSLLNVFNLNLTAQEAETSSNNVRLDGPLEETEAVGALDFKLSLFGTEKPLVVREATVNVAYLLKNDELFQRERGLLKDEIERADKAQKQQAKELQEIRSQLDKLGKEPADRPRWEELNEQLAIKRAVYEAQRKVRQDRFLRREAEMYQKAYERIQTEVAAYAKEFSIQVVRRTRAKPKTDATQYRFLDFGNRSATSEESARPKSLGFFYSPDAQSGLLGQLSPKTDPQIHHKILEQMNQDVVYSEESEPPLIIDITEDVLKRLKAKVSDRN